jgi:RHS repeat-associated protein
VLTATDPLGNTTTNTYDSNGNLLTVTSPVPSAGIPVSVTQFAYNSLGERTKITDPLNHSTTLTYTPAGLLTTVTDAQGNVTTYGYDSRGNRTSLKDALGNTTFLAYDSMNRPTGITYPDSTTAQFSYDYRGRRISATDQNGKTNSYTYDDADRLISAKDAANNTTAYAFDTENNLLSITDANGHITNFADDSLGRLVQTNFPSGQIETYGYDAASNLITKTDRNNHTISYTYDQLNRLTQKLYPDSTTVNYTYDNNSQVTQVTDPTGTYNFTFDNMGRLTGTSTQYSFLSGRTFTTSYSYDAASNRTVFTDPEGGTGTYVYDSLNRMQSLTPAAAITSGSFGFSYDQLSRRTVLTRPNTVTTNYTYDDLSRLVSVLDQVGSNTIDGATYTLDAAGNRTAKTDQLAQLTTNYGYSAIYQLLSATQGGNTTESYSFDPVGNRLSSSGVSPYSYNASNELASTPSGSYTYDNNGNTLTDAEGRSYTWDFENRLIQVVVPGTGTTTFKYDPMGRRIQKSGPLGTTNYLYDGASLVEEVGNSGNILARYVQGGWLDEHLSQNRGGTTSFYELDGNLSVTSLSSSSGAIAASYRYDSFGEQIATSGTIENLFRYNGRDYDVETGLYYNRSRYFDPSVGRFLSEDPIGFAGGVNFYSYVRNDPVNWIDPWGNARSQAECEQMLKQIKAMGAALANEIAKYDPVKDGIGGWPKAGGGVTIPGGHWIEMGQLAAGIVGRSAQYYKDCGNGGNPSIPQCIWDSVKKLKTLKPPVFSKTAAEYELDAQSQRYMAEFWKDILVGDVILGIVGTGGAAGGFGGAGAAATEGAGAASGSGFGGLVPAFAP